MTEFIGAARKDDVAKSAIDPECSHPHSISAGGTGVNNSLAWPAEVELAGDDRCGIAVEEPRYVDHVRLLLLEVFPVECFIVHGSPHRRSHADADTFPAKGVPVKTGILNSLMGSNEGQFPCPRYVRYPPRLYRHKIVGELKGRIGNSVVGDKTFGWRGIFPFPEKSIHALREGIAGGAYTAQTCYGHR